MNDARFTPDGCSLLTAAKDTTTQVWSLGTEVGKLRLSRAGCAGGQSANDDDHTYIVSTGAFDRKGTLVATASKRRARVWDVPTRALLKELPVEKQDVRNISFNHDGTLLAVGLGTDAEVSSSVIVYGWRAGDHGKVTATLPTKGSVQAVSFSPDGRFLLAAVGDGTALIWEIQPDGQFNLKQPLPHGTKPVMSAAWSHDGKRVVTTTEDKKACVWTIGISDSACRNLPGAGRWAAWSQHDDRFATVDGGGYVTVWISKTFERTRHQLGGGLYGVRVAFAPGDQHLIIRRDDRVLEVLDIKRWRTVYERGDAASIANFNISTDGRLLLTTHGDGTTKVGPFCAARRSRKCGAQYDPTLHHNRTALPI